MTFWKGRAAAGAVCTAFAVALVFSCNLYTEPPVGGSGAGSLAESDGLVSAIYLPDASYGTLLFHPSDAQAPAADEPQESRAGRSTASRSTASDWVIVADDGSNFNDAVKTYTLNLNAAKSATLIIAEVYSEFTAVSFSMDGREYPQGLITGIPGDGGLITVRATTEDGRVATYAITVVRGGDDLPDNSAGLPDDGGEPGAGLAALYTPTDEFGCIYYQDANGAWILLERNAAFNNAVTSYKLELRIGKTVAALVATPAAAGAVVDFTLNGASWPQGIFTNIPASGGTILVTVTEPSGARSAYSLRVDRRVLDRDDFYTQDAAFAALDQHLAQSAAAQTTFSPEAPQEVALRHFTMEYASDFAGISLFQGVFPQYIALDLRESTVGTALSGGGRLFGRIPKDVLFGVTKLVSLTLPDSVVKIDDGAAFGQGVFSDFLSLRSMRAAGVVALGAFAFSDCRDLQSLVLSAVGSLGNGAFAGCIRLRTLDLSAGGTGWTAIGDNIFDGLDDATLKQIDVRNGSGTTPVAIGDGAAYWTAAYKDKTVSANANATLKLKDIPFRPSAP
ncbi:MAG: leucine-rich repeat domain-containing protein [Spirochaetaceae bacterium]|jgi:hypothetical protein|nr:leucine-rich repeat domain-containing protein [Spirochaetaceae bacterium]